MAVPVRVAVVGALGHGVRHRKVIHELQEAGRVRLVAVCSRRPVESFDDAPLDGVDVFTDHRRMIVSAEPEVVVVSTPAHAHLPATMDAAAAGCDLLVEKPPAVTLEEYDELADAVDRTGVACQVGFQALASPALVEVGSMVRSGLVGEVSHVSVSGAWWRPDSYYRRTEWAGRRSLAGRPVADGALSNQFSHGVMQALAIVSDLSGAVELDQIMLERYRTRAIEVDDTACLRLTVRKGPPVVAAVTVSSNEFIQGEVAVHGVVGTVTLEYPTDRILAPGTQGWRLLPGRPSLLENLLDHRDDPAVPLAAPLAVTRPIVEIQTAIHRAPVPVEVPRRYLHPAPDGGGHMIDDVREMIRLAASRCVLFSELPECRWAERGGR